jgi:hypothetical protein
MRDVRATHAARLAPFDTTLPPCTILKLASGKPRRIGDVLEQMCELAGVTAEIKTDTGWLRPHTERKA